MSDSLTVGNQMMGKLALANDPTEKAKNLANREVKDKTQVDKATKGFEALLLHEMMKSMWATVNTEGLLGEDSNQGQIFRGMFHQAVSDEISKGKGIGIQQFLETELVKTGAASDKKMK